jgi:mannose-6-phosphate isomerase-like protein (cupin superfamily)
VHRVIRSRDVERSPGGTVKFEGEPHGASVSFFLVNNRPGEGPDLHRHPYDETWVVRSGSARFTAGEEEVDARAGDIVVVGANTPHKFKNTGSELLDIVCIHAAPTMVQENLA